MFGEIIHYILDLGSAIFLPIVMIILGLIVRLKPKKAIIAGITLGVAFTGMGIVLDFMFGTISPVAEQFVQNTGIQLNAIDVGWAPTAAIAWAWPYALLMFPLQIGINLLMLVFKKTDVLNVDLWNVWGKIFTATMVASVTNSVVLGFVAASIQVVLELIVGSLTQKDVQKLSGIPGITCSHNMIIETVVMTPINKLMDHIPGLNSRNFDADKIKEKLGVFAENSVMGCIIGFLLAICSGYTFGESLQTGIKVGTALVLFPMVAKLFMQALAPIADAASTFMKSKFKDREIFIGLDWPFLAGRSEIWIVCILLVPVQLGLAVLMAKFGIANTLPLAGIINIVMIVPALITTGGNIVRMFILGVIYSPIYLFVSSAFASATTELAVSVNALKVSAGQMITCYNFELPLFRYFFSNAFTGNIIAIIGLIVIAGLFVYYVIDKKKQSKVEAE